MVSVVIQTILENESEMVLLVESGTTQTVLVVIETGYTAACVLYQFCVLNRQESEPSVWWRPNLASLPHACDVGWQVTRVTPGCQPYTCSNQSPGLEIKSWFDLGANGISGINRCCTYLLPLGGNNAAIPDDWYLKQIFAAPPDMWAYNDVQYCLQLSTSINHVLDGLP